MKPKARDAEEVTLLETTMPCGGISDHWGEDVAGACFVCNGEKFKSPCTLFCEEWDCYLHYDCLPDFLVSDEGRLVIKHGHSIVAPGVKRA